MPKWQIRGLNKAVRELANRLTDSAVFWSWFFNGLRLASGLFLLPIILRVLPDPDLGMYYVFLSLSALAPLVDFGFSSALSRYVSYATSGAQTIQAQGMPQMGKSQGPNFELLWDLYRVANRLYAGLALILLVILALWGTYLVELRVDETSSPSATRVAWAVTLIATIFDIYSNRFINYLCAMDHVRTSTRYGVLAYCVRLAATAAMLLGGVGLLSLALGTFIGSFVQRSLARRRCLQLLSGAPGYQQPGKLEFLKYLKIFWPNTWRVGVQFMSGYLTVNANTAICLHVLGLESNLMYGLSVQLLTIASGMANVWVSVRWPQVSMLRAQHDTTAVRKVLWPRLWLSAMTFGLLAVCIVLIGPWMIHMLSPTKTLLPSSWLALLAVTTFFDLQFTVWTTLILTGNRMPSLWPTVATNLLSVTLALTFVHTTSLGLGALVLGPLIAGSLFNYWFWPFYAARGLNTGLLQFLFTRPAHKGGPFAPRG
jgi:hypothetical protein